MAEVVPTKLEIVTVRLAHNIGVPHRVELRNIDFLTFDITNPFASFLQRKLLQVNFVVHFQLYHIPQLL